MTGKAALGEPAQKLVHRLIDSPEPLGWEQQLKTRVGIQLSHARVYRFGEELGGRRVGFQAGFGATLGTVRTYASASAALIVGDLPGSDPALLIGNEGDFVVQDFNDRAVFKKPFAYVAVGGTAIAYNYFIEGRARYGKSDIDMKSHYGVLQWGVSIPLQSWIGSSWPRVFYTQSRRTPEFSGTAVGRDESIQRWGTSHFTGICERCS
jgi:lipid A 3-O-deacylase